MMSFFNVVVGVWTWVVCGSVVSSVSFRRKGKKRQKSEKKADPLLDIAYSSVCEV